MGKLYTITLSCFLLIGSSTLSFPQAATKSVEKPNNQEQGFLLLRVQHPGLDVRIDGKLIGFTPLPVLTLAPGSHAVVVNNPYQVNWFDQPWSQEVTIAASDTLIIYVLFKKSYSINSIPFGAAVDLNRKRVGTTPIFLSFEENQIKNVSLTKPGYLDTTFVIGRNDQRFYEIKLIPNTKRLDVVSSFPSRHPKKSRSKLTLYSAIGISLVSGGLALYFRERGNSNYNRYLRTGNPRQMNKFLSSSKRFDRLSAASFGVFQVGIIFSFYTLLKRANQ
ncbi:MAG: PEGA domain-containing protein [bacterium]